MTLTSPKTPSLRTSVLKAVFSIRKIAGDISIWFDVDAPPVRDAGKDPSRVKACVIGSVDSFSNQQRIWRENVYCTCLHLICGQIWIFWLKIDQWLGKTFPRCAVVNDENRIRQSYINIARLGSIHSLKRPCDVHVENLSSTSVFIHKPYRVDHLSRKTPRCYVSMVDFWYLCQYVQDSVQSGCECMSNP